uniref:Myotubularin related protein 9 [Monodelphis domestica] n=2 Tax=Lepeophtheirus salmonis TaxID=72036 RepID=A0A0K2USV3_LEPSM
MEFADLIKVSRVLKVILHRPFVCPSEMTLCITGHHLILSDRFEKVEELWILHRSIDSIERKNKSTIIIKCKDLKIIQVVIPNQDEFNDVVDTLEKLSAIDDLTRSYPFFYNPNFKQIEDGWSLFQPEEEFSKLVHSNNKEWRISYVNSDFSVCRTYPRAVVVPACISDGCLRASARYRQEGRFPTLSYRHANGTFLVRCSQPLSGPNNRRCKEDEKIFAVILNLSRPHSYGGRKGYIIDTRTSAASQSAKSKGGGYEIETYYTNWKRINKSIDRFHYLLDSYSKLMDAITEKSASAEKWLNKLTVSSWLTHVKEILNCACLIAQCLEKENASVVVHGSEGMDVTLCVTSLAQIILNPDCRTVRGQFLI